MNTKTQRAPQQGDTIRCQHCDELHALKHPKKNGITLPNVLAYKCQDEITIAYSNNRVHEGIKLTPKSGNMEPYSEEEVKMSKEAEAYHKRIEARRYEIWLAGNRGTIIENKNSGCRPASQKECAAGGWYGRNAPDNREKFIADLIGAELNPSSFLSKIKGGLKEEGVDPVTIEKIWEKMSIYKIVRDMLIKPTIIVDKTKTQVEKTRIVDGKPVKYLSTMERETRSTEEIHEWQEIHQFLQGHGSMDFLPRPARKTLYLNPDGSRFLNTSPKVRGPIQAKMAFATLHKADPKRVMVERVVYQRGSELLRQLNLPNKQTSIYVVSLRKLSNEAASTYYDPNPSFTERRGIDKEWETTYQWTAGTLKKMPKGEGDVDVIPFGSHILTVRDLERAVLSGATFAEDDTEQHAMEFDQMEDSLDDRLRTPDDIPAKDIKRLSETEAFLRQALLQCDNYELAEMMMIDFTKQQGLALSEEVQCAISNTFAPYQDNPVWTDLTATLLDSQLQRFKQEDDGRERAKRAADYMTGSIEDIIFGLQSDQFALEMKIHREIARCMNKIQEMSATRGIEQGCRLGIMNREDVSSEDSLVHDYQLHGFYLKFLLEWVSKSVQVKLPEGFKTPSTVNELTTFLIQLGGQIA